MHALLSSRPHGASRLHRKQQKRGLRSFHPSDANKSQRQQEERAEEADLKTRKFDKTRRISSRLIACLPLSKLYETMSAAARDRPAKLSPNRMIWITSYLSRRTSLHQSLVAFRRNT